MKLAAAVLFFATLLLFPLVAHAAVSGGDAVAAELPLHGLHLAATSGVGVYAWVASSQRAHREDVERVRGALNECEQRIGKLEEHGRHAPSAAQMTEVISGVRVASTRMETVTESLKAMSMRFDRYEEHMLKAGR